VKLTSCVKLEADILCYTRKYHPLLYVNLTPCVIRIDAIVFLRETATLCYM